MAYEDDSYGLDSDGNRILIGLTYRETREFELLDGMVANLKPVSPITDDGRAVIERRWLVLYDKHEEALRRSMIDRK